MKKVALYRHYDKDDVLLYVGISLYVFNRLKQHQDGSCWAERAVTMKTEWLGTRQDALLAEEIAIKNENPLHNVRHNKPVSRIKTQCKSTSGMKKSEAVEYYGSQTNLAKALGVTPQAVQFWGEDVPRGKAFEIEALTKGVLKAISR